MSRFQFPHIALVPFSALLFLSCLHCIKFLKISQFGTCFSTLSLRLLASLGLTPSFGFGDRLCLATSGHIAAVQGTKFAPIFAQQSVRENARTGRIPRQVMDDAKRSVKTAAWDAPWGADADHLKTVDDMVL
jgi:hypothetical protein